MNDLQIDIQLVVNELSKKIADLVVENALLRAQITAMTPAPNKADDNGRNS